MKRRCEWCGRDPLYVAYHDNEWGVPVHDDRSLFEMLILEGAQAGLSWMTILRKRENYRDAFHGFDRERIAAYGQSDINRLLSDPGIVRNRRKIESAVKNARAVSGIKQAFGTLDAYFWRYVDGIPVQNRWKSTADVPAGTPLSDAVSRDLKQRGFSFVGSTICYAFMQSIGMVNDHVTGCFRYKEIKAMGKPSRDTSRPASGRIPSPAG